MNARSLALIVLVVCLCCTQAAATWSHDPTENNPVCTAENSQFEPTAAGDAAGGAIIVWADYRGSEYNIYAQRIDAYGDVLWTPDGAVVCGATDTQMDPIVVADGEGGAIVAWRDYRGTTSGIFAQRIDASGNMLWTSDGVAVCDTTGEVYSPAIISDGAGGAMLVWEVHAGVNYGIYAQRVDASGTPLWTPHGVAIIDQPTWSETPAIAPDGGGGAIIVWSESRFISADIFAQRLDASGAEMWGPGGKIICDEGFAIGQDDPGIVTDGTGGAIIVWADYRNGDLDIFGQRVDRWGSDQWTSNGVPLCDEATNQNDCRVVTDGQRGILLVWTDARASSEDVYAQSVDCYGDRLWAADGVTVCTASGIQAYAEVVADGAGGVVVAWQDQRLGDGDIYAQRLDSSGSAVWATDGVEISGAFSVQGEVCLADDGAGGAVIAWQDARTPFEDIYAQRVERNGYLGYPCAEITSVVDHPDDQGGQVIVSWAPSYLDEWPVTVLDYYTLWRRLGGTASRGSEIAPAPWLLDSADIEALKRYGWVYVDQVDAMLLPEYGYIAPTFGDSTESGTVVTDYMVLAHNTYINEYWTSESVSGYSIDNVAPGAPIALAAAPEQTDVELTWSPSGLDDEDLDFYNIYRSDVSGFTPGPGTFVGTAFDTLYADIEPGGGTWYYLVTAEDIHANEGAASNEASAETWTGVVELPASFALRGCHPNPFNPVTVIAYDVPESGGKVTLEIFDVRGRLVRTLVSCLEGPGRKQSVWRGEDGTGAPVSSGIYFCRMTAEGFAETAKLTLLK